MKKLALFGLLVCAGAVSVRAADLTWTGSGGTPQFSDALNWNRNTGSGGPATNDNFIFRDLTGTSAVTLNHDLSGSPFTFNHFSVYGDNTAYTFKGSVFVFNALHNYGSKLLTIDGSVDIPSSWLNPVDNGTTNHGSVTITGTVFNSGGGDIIFRQSMVGGTMTIGSIYAPGKTFQLAGPDYGRNSPLITIGRDYQRPVTVIGDINAGSFANFRDTGNNYGEVVFVGSNTFSGIANNSVSITKATLTLDYSSGDKAKLSGTVANFYHTQSTIRLVGTGSFAETVNYFQIGAYSVFGSGGNHRVERLGGNESTIMVGAGGISRNGVQTRGNNTLSLAVHTLDINESGVIGTTDTRNDWGRGNVNNNGIIGAFVTIGNDNSAGRDWAFKDTDNFLKAYTGYATVLADNGAANVLVTGSGGIAGYVAVNSLKLNSAAADNLLALNGNEMRVNSGGVLYVGDRDYAIGSGTLYSNNGGNELILWQSGVGQLTIDADIRARSFTKAGSGAAVINGELLKGFTAGNGNDGFIALNKGALILGADQRHTLDSALLLYSGTLDLNGHTMEVATVGGDGIYVEPLVIKNSAGATTANLLIGTGSYGAGVGGLATAFITGNVHLQISTGTTAGSNANIYGANDFTGGVTFIDTLSGYNSLRIYNTAWFGSGTIHLAGNGGFSVMNTDTIGWENTGLTNDMLVTGNGNIIQAENRSIIFSNKWSGDGSLTLMINGNNTSPKINGDLSGYEGTLRLRSIIRDNANQNFVSSNRAATDWSKTDLVLETGGTYAAAGNSGFTAITLQSAVANQVFKIGNLSTSSTATGDVNLGTGGKAILRSGVNTGVTTFEIGGRNENGTFAGHISNYGGVTGDAANGYTYADTAAGYTTALTKVGTGTLNLTNLNTYSGVTTVSGGVLLISGTGSLSRSTSVIAKDGGKFDYRSSVAMNADTVVEAQNGGNFAYNGSAPLAIVGLNIFNGGILSGTGSINSPMIFNHSVLSPGNSVGTLTFGGNQTWGDFTYDWEIDDHTGAAGTDWDLAVLNGNLTLSGDVLVNVTGLAGNFATATAQDYEIMTINGAHTFDVSQWKADGIDGDYEFKYYGNSVYLNFQAIPEPSTWALLIGGAALLVVLRRRKK